MTQLSFIMPLWLITYILWNIVTFILMMLDKRRARQQHWRIRERTLFLCALFFGATGVLIGMYRFRHKTRHWSFIMAYRSYCYSISPVATCYGNKAGFSEFSNKKLYDLGKIERLFYL